MTSKSKRMLILTCLLLAPTLTANGTTIDPLVWQQLVVDADFVGIAECTTAGGTVAEYVVVESWKGPKVGTKMSMRIAIDYWGEEQYAMVLCGERVLVTAFQSRAPSRLVSFSSGGGVPLWWRHIPSDFRLPLFQGMIRDPANSQKFFDSDSAQTHPASCWPAAGRRCPSAERGRRSCVSRVGPTGSAILTAKEKSREWGKAFNTLTVHRPAAVRDYLVAWVNPRENWRDENLGYVLGSYFAWKCGVERKEHLIALLAAKSAYVRVAGAVYLCFEDRELGMRELEKLLALEGDPGAWAALALARRGRKSAVPHALQVIKTPTSVSWI